MANKKNTSNPVTLEDIFKAVTDIRKDVTALGARIDALEEADASPVATTKQSKPSTSRKSNGKKSAKSDNDFDSAEYEATCKKFGVWSTKMGRGFVRIGKAHNPDGNIIVRYMNGEITEQKAKALIEEQYPDLYKGKKGKKRS